jgi:hypothetical protein
MFFSNFRKNNEYSRRLELVVSSADRDTEWVGASFNCHGRLPFRLRSAPRVANPRRHLDSPTWRSRELRRASTVSLRRAQKAVVRTVALHYPARPPDPAATCFALRQLTKCQKCSITRSLRRIRPRPLPDPLGRTPAAHPPSSYRSGHTKPVINPRPSEGGAQRRA